MEAEGVSCQLGQRLSTQIILLCTMYVGSGAHSSQANYRLHSADGNTYSLADEVVSSDYTLAEEVITEPAARCDRLTVTAFMECDSYEQVPAGQVTGQQSDTVTDNNEYQLAGATGDEYENFTSIQRYLLHIVQYPVHQPKYLRMANLIS